MWHNLIYNFYTDVENMKKEKSCGAIVYRIDNGNVLVLMVKHVNGGHWSFPKGHVEQNETEAQTAKREIKEETGIDVEIDTRFKEKVTYSPKKDVLKDVIFFAAKTEKEDFIRQQEEISKIECENLYNRSDIGYQVINFEEGK